MKKFIEKNKILLIIFILFIILLGGIIFICVNGNTKVYEFNNKDYSFRYDSTWKISKETEGLLKLLHKKSGSELNIRINELEENLQYKSIEELFDTTLYNIQEQNKDYKLLYKENVNLTKNNLNGYKVLFENENNEVEICMYKQGSKLVLITYEADYENFDILLDSANNIIYSFSLAEQKFNVQASINLETKPITYVKEENIIKLLKNVKQVEVTNENYLVKCLIPDNFKNDEEEANIYSFQNINTGEYIDLRANIYNLNLYEYLDKNNTFNIYSNYNLNSYNKANSVLQKGEVQPLNYIYKNSYYVNDVLYENIEIVFELNENHILSVVISSTGVGIPEELVKMIKVI